MNALKLGQSLCTVVPCPSQVRAGFDRIVKALQRSLVVELHQMTPSRFVLTHADTTVTGLHSSFPGRPRLCPVLIFEEGRRAIEVSGGSWVVLFRRGVFQTVPLDQVFRFVLETEGDFNRPHGH